MQSPESNQRGAWQRAILRDDADAHRPVGWVELFFDLVFVVIISVLAHDLEGSAHSEGLLRFILQFVAVFWVWNGFTYYTERFESHGLENRLFTFLGILTVAGLAVWGEDGLGHNYLGFAASFLLARGLNILMWLRAGRHEPRFRRAAAGFTAGYVASFALIGVSLAVDEAWRLALWGLAVLVDIAAPAVTARFQFGLPGISRDKFPERFGLLTLIVLGEVVASVIQGVATANEATDVSVPTIADAILGLAIGFGLWWVYFDFVARRPTRPDFVIALVWVYLHIAMLIGMVIVGVGISEAVLSGEESASALVLRSLGITLVAIALLELTLDRAPDEPTGARLSPLLKAGIGVALVLLASFAAPPSTTAVLMVGVAALAVPAAYGARVYYRRPARG
ncbi:low temperature requirement protein A [Glaciihabitans sp. INWT7]|uniref:low temperature requirement protein A n=1 Tax=Glaciihabitans sp. INWT7 TaxID=2596912 RepID=UPI0016284AB1|nr:low temperature requirement protein A [Glaciihabitans sp. INWT7]